MIINGIERDLEIALRAFDMLSCGKSVIEIISMLKELGFSDGIIESARMQTKH